MYVLTVVGYSDRSFESEVFGKMNHLIEYACDLMGFDYTDDDQYEICRCFCNDNVGNGKFVYNEKEWIIIEV